MGFQNWLENLQNKPLKVRVRILWVVCLAVAVALIAIWSLSIKAQIKNIGNDKNNKDNSSPVSEQPENTVQYIAVERVEDQGNSLKIYFNVNNNTNDILNFSKMEDIELKLNDQTKNPLAVRDRQGNAFVGKVLSKTQVFGIITFDKVQEDSATLTFGQLFFEKHPELILKQSLDLNFKQLKLEQNLRN